MMKKIFNSPLTWGLLTALALGACTDSDSLSNDLGIGTTGAPEDALSFSTYLGQSKKETRAGATGNIDTEVLKGADYGFGVFAYYSGTGTYANMRRRGSNANAYPNFMYNQEVKYNAASLSEITKWEYSPIKYWPNEVTNDANAGVDDQEDDADNVPAITDYKYGGNISFFAYAPYVDVTQNTQTGLDGATPTGPASDGTNGIIAMSGNKFIGNTTGDVYSDPYVKYALPSGEKKFVDLLWGTKGSTNQDVNNEGNAGVTGNPAGGTQYAKSVLDGYTVNANLRKQTTTGTIDFLFKHALSKVGGSYQGTQDGADDDETTPTNGLMVILDLDKDGEEKGGELEPWNGEAPNANTKYTTKVTVRDIQISAKMLVEDNNGVEPGQTGYVTTYYASETIGGAPVGTGRLDLATGQWSKTVDNTDNENEAVTIEHNITSDATDGTKVTTSAATLSEVLAEPENVAMTADAFKNILPLGVTTVAKNVYADEANALVFFPGTWPQLTITIDYIVRTYDENLADAYSAVGQKITKTLTFDDAVELNKQYNILIHLGLTSVKFTASVDDWDDGSTTTTTTDVNGEPVDITETEVDHEVYNPVNVKNPVTALTVSHNGTDANIANGDDNADIIVNTTGAATTKLSVQATYTTTGNPTGDVTNNASYTSSADWVTVDAQGNVAIAANNTYSDAARTATITVKYENVTKDITVKQNYKKITSFYCGSNLKPAFDVEGGIYSTTSNNANIILKTQEYNTDNAAVGTEAREEVGAKVTITNVAVNDGTNDIANQATWSGNTVQYAANTSSKTYTYTVTVKYLGQTATFTATQAAATPACAAAHYVYPTGSAYTYKGTVTSSPTSNDVSYSITRALANTTNNIQQPYLLTDLARYLGALYRMDNGATVNKIKWGSATYDWTTTGEGVTELNGSNWRNGTTTLVSVMAHDATLASLLTSSSQQDVTITLIDSSNAETTLTIHVTIR